MIAPDSEEHGPGPIGAVLDVDQLVLPISSETPAGSALRGQEVADSPYAIIRARRTEARLRERDAERGDGTSGESRAAWEDVLEVAQGILTGHSIDLEVAAYLIEAAVRLHSFSGLSDGLCVLVSILNHYWDTAHPLPDDNGHELRLSYAVGLNGVEKDGTLIAPLQRCPIVSGPDAEYSTADWVAAQAVDKLETEQRQRHLESGLHPLEDITDQAARTPADFVAVQRGAIHQSLFWMDRLVELVDSRCPPGLLHVSRIRNVLHQALETMAYLYGPEEVIEPADSAPYTEVPQTGRDLSPGASLPDCPSVLPAGADAIHTREQALHLLMVVAEWFRQTEPHSPVSYSIEQIVRRAQMPLPELLQHLIPDQEARSLFLSLSAMASPLDQNVGFDEHGVSE